MPRNKVTIGSEVEEGELTPKTTGMDIDKSDTPMPLALAVEESASGATNDGPGGRMMCRRERKSFNRTMFEHGWRLLLRCRESVPWTRRRGVRHDELAKNDAAIHATICGQDMDLIDTRVPEEIAHLGGELGVRAGACRSLATSRYKKAEAEEDRLYDKCNCLLEALENRGDHSYKFYRHSRSGHRTCQSATEPFYTSDDTPVGTSVVTTSHTTGPTVPPTDTTTKDVEMNNTPVRAPLVPLFVKKPTDWKNATGLLAMIIKYKPAGPVEVAPPPPGTWLIKEGCLSTYRSINDYQAALNFIDQSCCWVVTLSTVWPFVEAQVRVKDQSALTILQDYVLKHYCMVPWVCELLKKFFANRSAVEALQKFWAVLTRIVYNNPDTTTATYYQQNGVVPKWCPFIDDFHMLNGGMFRGFCVLNALTGLPIKGVKTVDLPAGSLTLAVAQALLILLLVPNSYKQAVQTYSVNIEPNENLVLWLEDNTVDNAFNYLRQFTMQIVSDMRLGWDVEILKATLHSCTNTVSKNHNKSPKGKKMPYNTNIFHAPRVPWPDQALNTLQGRLLLVPNIPTMPAYGSTVLGYFNHLPLPSNCSGSNSTSNTSPSIRGLMQVHGRRAGATSSMGMPHTNYMANGTLSQQTSATSARLHAIGHVAHARNIVGEPRISWAAVAV
ncbi:hypothetical protein C8R45DRAFT_924940 [Mycena sanguinolenta]|nr:hypothetical protein C8R45DRAFT_924940 [Mycena sanguinolenta]